MDGVSTMKWLKKRKLRKIEALVDKMNEIKLFEDGAELADFKISRKTFEQIWKIAFDNALEG